MSTGGDKIDPDQLESTEFPVVRRGFEPELVRTQLVIVADEIRRLRKLVVELEGEVSALEARAPADLAAEAITEAIGEEAVRVLEAARTAASERADRADREAAEIIALAEGAAADLGAEADANRERLEHEAKRAADDLVEQGRERGRDMVAEARTVRERMLTDLARKRQIHRAEVEQLRAGRDRLLASLVGAQQTLDQSTAELVSAVPEAQAAAERAGLRISSEPELTVDQLEAEIATARLIDHPMLEGIREPGRPDELDAVDAVDERDDTDELDEVADTDEVDAVDEVADADAGEVDAVDEVADTGEVDVAPYDVETEDGEPVSSGDSAELNDLFARLRSSHDRSRLEPGVVAEIIDLVVEPDGAYNDVVEPDGVDADAVVEPDGVDADAAACSDAVDEIARSLKRLVVDEQGDLLDGLRRVGADAVREVLDDGAAYAGVLDEPLQVLVAAVAGDAVEIETGDAESSVQTLLVEPVQSRLRAALDDTDDPDELSTTVRAVYRECRSRRVGEAANAAVSVVYEIAVGARGSSPA